MANASPRIVLHVGALKTASTYLQRRLRANVDQLRRRGIYVPVLPRFSEMAANAKILPPVLNQRPSPMFERAYPEVDVTALDPARLVAELFDSWQPDRESIVISAESFQPNHARRLRELLPKTGPCVVVLFVRRQDRWIDSYFNQLVKTNQMDKDISTFVTRMCETDEEWPPRPDWFRQYEAWREAFGNCNVVFYDEVAKDLFAAFLTAAGLNPVPDLIDIDRVQVSVDVYALAYLLDLKTLTDLPDFLRRRAACQKASRQLGYQETKSLLSNSDLARVRKRFEGSNQRLMKAVGRGNETNPLRLDGSCDSDVYCDLRELYTSTSYARYRELADAIYMQRNRRDRWLSVFKGRFQRQ